MVKNYFILLILFIGVSNFVLAQEVSGTVLDDSSQPLPGVTVVVKDTSTGTTTDLDGRYSINANDGDVLEFSYVGFDTQRIVVTSNLIDATMQSGVSLDEVVLIGSRNPARTVTDSPVAVDVIDMAELTAAGPQVSVTQILNYVAPSFSSNTQTVSDGTDHIDPAQLQVASLYTGLDLGKNF